MKKGIWFTLLLLVISSVVTWFLIRNLPIFKKELYGLIVVLVVAVIGLIAILINTKAWIMLVLVYGVFLLNTAVLYWKFGAGWKLVLLALVVVFIGFVHAIMRTGEKEEEVQQQQPQPEVYNAEEKSTKEVKKSTSKKIKKKK